MGVLANLKKFLKDGTGLNHVGASNIGGDYTTDILTDMLWRGRDAAAEGKDLERAMREAYRARGPKKLWQNTTSGERAYSTSNPTGIWGLRENWQEVPGPIPRDYNKTLSEDEAMDLLTGDNGRVFKSEFDDNIKADQDYLDEIEGRTGFDAEDITPEDIASERDMLGKKVRARARMDTPDEQIMLDPQMYMGEEYAPWIRSKASKYINGEY